MAETELLAVSKETHPIGYVNSCVGENPFRGWIFTIKKYKISLPRALPTKFESPTPKKPVLLNRMWEALEKQNFKL